MTLINSDGTVAIVCSFPHLILTCLSVSMSTRQNLPLKNMHTVQWVCKSYHLYPVV